MTNDLATPLDVARIKADFPILKRQVHGKRLVYLDSAASAQKPQSVLDAMDRAYREFYANVHRGVYTIAEEATAAYEGARTKVAGLLHAPTDEIVFTKNVTEAINLVAYAWARANVREGDAVVLTQMEHHANVVPWHQLAAERGVELRWIPLTDEYRLDLSGLDQLLDGAKLLTVTAASNVLGTINEILQMALLEPDLAVLDETDSGLDIDALRVVADGIREVRGARPTLGILLITHYRRILDHLTPDKVHILVDGRIVETGGPELAAQLDREGFEAFREHAGAST